MKVDWKRGDFGSHWISNENSSSSSSKSSHQKLIFLSSRPRHPRTNKQLGVEREQQTSSLIQINLVEFYNKSCLPSTRRELKQRISSVFAGRVGTSCSFEWRLISVGLDFEDSQIFIRRPSSSSSSRHSFKCCFPSFLGRELSGELNFRGSTCSSETRTSEKEEATKVHNHSGNLNRRNSFSWMILNLESHKQHGRENVLKLLLLYLLEILLCVLLFLLRHRASERTETKTIINHFIYLATYAHEK